MYSRLGGIEVPEIDAVTACHNFPREWTLKPWTRPDGRPDVLIPTDWQTMGVLARIDLARSTMIDGHGPEIDDVAKADEAISAYLAGTTPPEKDKTS
jgi:hypothetical protein